MNDFNRWLFVLGYILTIALCAQLTYDIDLPNFSIPVTGQTLAILTGAFFLAPFEAFVGIIIYCLFGILGLPVFSDGNSGWEAFSGNSLGYFLGFILSAFLVSQEAGKMRNNNIWKIIWIMTWGTFIILICGASWLSFRYGVASGIENGFTPFIAGGLVKILLGALIVFSINRLFLSES